MKGASRISKDTLDGCRARRTCAGADRELDGLQSSELRLIAVHDRRRKGGNRARTADDGNMALTSLILESRDARDELPPVGQIDVVATGFDGGSRDSIVLLLERSRGMDEDPRSGLLQKVREFPVVGIEPQRLLGAEAELPGGFQSTIVVAASYEQTDGWISGKACADAMPEKSIATQNENRVQPDPSRLSLRSQGGK
jgi:hypothetical protein